jgi:hypothetical protein
LILETVGDVILEVTELVFSIIVVVVVVWSS